MIELVTGEKTNHPDQELIDEYNKINITFMQNCILSFTKSEIEQMHDRVMELRNVLVVEQLRLF